MNLSLILVIPFLTGCALLFFGTLQQVRIISAIGAAIQLILIFFCLYFYLKLRNAGSGEAMLMQSNYSWYAPLHINYHIGVDGISLSMILLTAVVVLTGVLISWKMEFLTKEFFFLLMLLSLGHMGYLFLLIYLRCFFSWSYL